MYIVMESYKYRFDTSAKAFSEQVLESPAADSLCVITHNNVYMWLGWVSSHLSNKLQEFLDANHAVSRH